MFEQTGVVTLTHPISEEALLEVLLETGAQTYAVLEDQSIEVYTQATELESLGRSLTAAGYTIGDTDLRWIPTNTLEVEDEDQQRSLLKLIEALEDLEDVQQVTANFEAAFAE